MSETNRLFINADDIKDDTYRVTDEDLHYLKNVLRAKPGDGVELRDGSNKIYLSVVDDISEKTMSLKIQGTKALDSELPIQITLAQALPKSDKMELIIQKCVELGAHDIIPVRTEHCVVKITDDKEKNRIERWQKISKAAALQSGRALVPAISKVRSWPELLSTFTDYRLVLLPWELEDQNSLKKILFENPINPGNPGNFLVIIGPEGGFAHEEIAAAKKAGAITITLGKRILRTETAGMAILSMLNYIFN
jgi:16S rRNA (uracil1498-N3)-methyltransferase